MHSDDYFTKLNARQSFPLYGIDYGVHTCMYSRTHTHTHTHTHTISLLVFLDWVLIC